MTIDQLRHRFESLPNEEYACGVHLTFAVANAITIIGIPFAWAHVKLAGASLFPVGKTVQDLEVVDEAMRNSARARVEELRS